MVFAGDVSGDEVRSLGRGTGGRHEDLGMARRDPLTSHMAIEQAGDGWDEHVALGADLKVQSPRQVGVCGFQELAFVLSWYYVILRKHKQH